MHTIAMAKSATLLLVLLNPFLLAVYLLGIIRDLNLATFFWVMLRAALISGIVFVCFAWLGDFIFADVLQVRFSSFLVFGGIVFLIIGVRFVFQGPDAVELLRGSPEHVAGAVAMPFMIGPGTINASVLAGSRLNVAQASAAIGAALGITVLVVIALKLLHDYMSQRRVKLVERYVDLCGRVSALVIGTIAVEMIFQGVEGWLRSIHLLTN